VDEIKLPLKNGVNHIAIETVNYYVNSFYALMQKDKAARREKHKNKKSGGY
jgi:hypothetical protein